LVIFIQKSVTNTIKQNKSPKQPIFLSGSKKINYEKEPLVTKNKIPPIYRSIMMRKKSEQKNNSSNGRIGICGQKLYGNDKPQRQIRVLNPIPLRETPKLDDGLDYLKLDAWLNFNGGQIIGKSIKANHKNNQRPKSQLSHAFATINQNNENPDDIGPNRIIVTVNSKLKQRFATPSLNKHKTIVPNIVCPIQENINKPNNNSENIQQQKSLIPNSLNLIENEDFLVKTTDNDNVLTDNYSPHWITGYVPFRVKVVAHKKGKRQPNQVIQHKQILKFDTERGNNIRPQLEIEGMQQKSAKKTNSVIKKLNTERKTVQMDRNNEIVDLQQFLTKDNAENFILKPKYSVDNEFI